MKKDIFKTSLILSSICALFSLCIFVKPNSAVNVSADGAVPDNVLPNAVDYYVYRDVVGMFDYSWNFTTYDDVGGVLKTQYQQQYNKIDGIGTDVRSISGTIYYATGSWDSSISVTGNFGNGYWVTPNGVCQQFVSVTVDSGNLSVYLPGVGSLVVGNRPLFFVRDATSASSGTINAFYKLLYDNGDFYYFGDIPSVVNERDYIVGLYNSLVSDYNNLVSFNEYVDYVNVSVHYEITMDFYMRTSGTQGTQYYIKPKSFNFLTTVEMFNYDASDYVVSYDIVDTLDLTNITYYYAYPSLSNYLVLRTDDLNYLYLEYYNNNSAQIFRLDTANVYLETLKKDNVTYGTGTDTSYFRKEVNYMFSLVNASYVDYVNNYYQGVEDGYINGFNAGKLEGYSDGVAQGYEDGLATNPTVATIFSGILQISMVPVNFFLGIFNFEILGINMAAFVSALLTVAVTIIIIRVVTGKKND